MKKRVDLENKAIRSVIALTGRTIFLQLLTLVALLFLQVFLEVEELGVFFIVTAVFQIFTLFTDVGLGAALIQKKDAIDDRDLGTVFVMQEVLVIFAVILGLLATPLVTSFAQLDTAGVTLYHVLLFTLFISSLKVIPSILLERKLAFEKQIVPQIIESLIYNGLAVGLAWRGWGITAYSWAFLVSSLAGLPIYYLLSPWKVNLSFASARAKNLLSFGLFYQGKSFLAVVKDNLFTFVMSAFVGKSGIGYWGTAQRWALFPYRFIVDSVTKVTFPAYSRAQENLALLSSGIERSLFAVSTILLPVYAAVAVNVGSLITLFPKYGKWEPALISFYFLCAQSAITALTNILVNVLDATGRVKTTLYLMVVWIIGTWGLSLLFIGSLSFTGIAVAQFLVSLTIVIVIILVRRFVRFDFIGNILPAFVATFLMIAGMLVFNKILPVAVGSILATTALGGIIYLAVVFLMAKGKIKDTISLIIRSYQK